MWLRLRAALLIGAVLSPVVALAQLAARPPTGKYCAPLAFRDQVVGVGYKAIVRAAPGCTKPAYIRKENSRTGSVIGEPSLVPVGEVYRVWLFTHRLTYSLDGKSWQKVVIR